jgi:hypothetical protein
MNNQQLPSAYITADIVTLNSQKPLHTQSEQRLIVSDIFDIPDIDIPIQQQQPQPQQLFNTSAVNFINSINHNAMTDVMNQLAIQKSKTPSVSTKKTDVSIQVPVSLNKAQVTNVAPVTLTARTSASAASAASSSAAGQIIPVTGTRTTKRNRSSVNNKVIIEEEDKDSAIDYDDDEPDIKKMKLSLFHFVKDITFNLIFAIPFLRTKLNAILKEQTLALNQIERIFDEFKDQLNKTQLECIKKYVCEDGIRDKLNFILETGFNKILEDGVIDINDAPQFNQLVYFIIKSFNEINQGKVYRFNISREHVMLLLHFILKSVFSLTLKGQEEQMAIGLLNTSFKLVQLEVLPLVSKRWYHKFRICNEAKDIEDIIE